MRYTEARELVETILDTLNEESTKEAKAMARGHMVKRYGKGKVTFESHSGGHFVEHDDGKGDTYAHTFHPKTGKISREPHATSSYYGESTTILDQMKGARAILSEAIELLAEGDNKYNSMENKPSTNKSEYKLTKPVAKPSAQGRATRSPVVKFGKRTTSRRYVTRANRWALRQIARNKSAVSEDIDQLDEGTRRTARLSAAVAKAQKRGEKVGPRSPLGKAAAKARAKYMRSEDKRELKPGAIENRMKWQAKYPGPSQPRGFGSYGF